MSGGRAAAGGNLLGDLCMHQNSSALAAPRISTREYSAGEIIGQFLAIYNSMDFTSELEFLGISRFHVFRRRKALREFRALCIALWGLALEKSFPKDSAQFFDEFRASSPVLAGDGKAARQMHSRVAAYRDILDEKKDTDFLPVAGYLAAELSLHAEDVRRLRLKLSLFMRNLYTLIFDKLV